MEGRNTYFLKIKVVIAFLILTAIVKAQPRLIINEVSQGTNAKEYVELLVTGTPGCGSNNCLDLRGYYIDDNNGFFASGGSVGIAQGIVRFTQDPIWECVPFGTLIVVYNENDVNGSIPPNDLSMSDGNCRMIIPSNNCTLFERHMSQPSGANQTIPTTGFVPCGSWNSLAMSNGGDSFQTISPSNLIAPEFAVSYANNQFNTIIYFNVTMGNSVIYNANSVDNNPYNQANWTYGAVPAFETPGSPNNPANAAWITSMNNNCSPFPVPVLTAVKTDATCNCNGSATITTTGGIRPYTYSWSGGVLSSDSTATDLCPGNYIVTVTGANGCSETISIDINSSAALTATVLTNNVSCTGANNGSAQVNVTGGSGTLTYTWDPPVSTGNLASGLTPGTYSVTVSENGGCPVNNTFIITEPLPLSLTLTKSDAGCYAVCNGEATVTVTGGTTPYTYSWDNGNLTDQATNVCAGNLCLTVTDTNGCLADTCIIIDQPAEIVTNTSVINATCSLSTGTAMITAAGGSGQFTYSWDNGSVNDTIRNLSPGQYCVEVADGNNCIKTTCVTIGNDPGVAFVSSSVNNPTCFGDCNGSIILTASTGIRPYTYSWSTISSTDSTASSLCAGSYTTIVTDSSGCKDTLISTVTTPDDLVVLPVTPPAICIGGSATLSASATGGTPAYSFSWSSGVTTVSPLVTQQYTVEATDINGCQSDPANVTVTVYDSIRVTIDPILPACPGGSVTLNSNTTGGNGNYSFSWMPGSSSSPDLTLTPAVAGTYTIIVNDGCTTPPDTAYTEVQINNSSPVDLTITQNKTCVPFCVQLSDNTSGSLSSQWTVNGITQIGQQVEYCFEDSGRFDVSLYVEGANGCTGQITLPDTISAYPSPVAAFTYSPEQITVLNPQVQLTNLSEGASLFYWSVGDSIFFDEDPLLSFVDTGCYVVRLKAENNFGCTDSTSEIICVEDDYAIYFPNAFSPNGDGLNDHFGPVGYGIASSDYLMQIYDRWGNLIFTTSQPLKSWDGKAGGSVTSPEDVYVYKVKVLDTSGILHNYKGRVTLVK